MRNLPAITDNAKVWGENFRRYLARALNQVDAKDQYSSAAEDGVLLWDRENGYPVISKSGEWRQIILEDGHYGGNIPTDQSAVAADTAYALTYTSTASSGITNGTPASRLVFDEAGEYMVSFSAQIGSSSASTVNFWFWPRVNGADVAGSTMKSALHQNDAVLVVSRTVVFNFSAGDYLEAMWAVDSTSGSLQSTAATSFAPAAPSSTISITRLHG